MPPDKFWSNDLKLVIAKARLVCHIEIMKQLLPALCLFFLLPFSPSWAEDKKQVNSLWNGIWFTCEFAQRQRAPDDECQMFDDEGFEVKDGVFYYLRMLGSEETACRGNKKGQCFKAELPKISVSQREIGKIQIGETSLVVRYLGCGQLYHFHDRGAYFEAIPDDKRCLWARDRRFYVARYQGKVEVQ